MLKLHAKDEIKKNLEEIVKNQSIDNVGKDAIYYMIKMATTNSDIDLIVKALKSYICLISYISRDLLKTLDLGLK